MPTERSTIYADSGRLGFLYVLQNPFMRVALPFSTNDLYHIDGPLLKIGATRKHPLQRLDELGAATGVPGQFELAYFRDFADAFTAERLVHEQFSSQRVDKGREFFAAPLDEVIDFINALPTSVDYRGELASKGVTGGTYYRATNEVATPMADLFACFDQDGPPGLDTDEQAQCRALEARLR